MGFKGYSSRFEVIVLVKSVTLLFIQLKYLHKTCYPTQLFCFSNANFHISAFNIWVNGVLVMSVDSTISLGVYALLLPRVCKTNKGKARRL
jgi:hypothetical protein